MGRSQSLFLNKRCNTLYMFFNFLFFTSALTVNMSLDVQEHLLELIREQQCYVIMGNFVTSPKLT